MLARLPNKSGSYEGIDAYEIIKFEDGDFCLDVNVSPNEDTVWLTENQIAELYMKQALIKPY